MSARAHMVDDHRGDHGDDSREHRGDVRGDVEVAGHAPQIEIPPTCRIGAGLLAARPRTRRSSAVAASVAAHVGLLVAVSLLRVSTPTRAQPEEKAVLVRLPSAFARPAPVTARAQSKPPARRRPQQKFTQPLVVPAPTPIVQPEPEPIAPEPFAEEPEGAIEESPIGADSEPVGPTSDVSPAGGVIGGTGSALEIGQVAHPPVLLAQEKPEYPRAARFDRIEGRVLLRAVIGVDGRIEPDEIRVLQSVPALDAAAITALRGWRFSPGRDAAGNLVRVLIEIPFEFSLR
jgi:protein TonB